MALFSLTPEEIATSKLLDAGWYPFMVTAFDTKPAKKDGSTNYIWTLKGQDPVPGFGGDPKGIKLSYYVSEKFKSPALKLALACGMVISPGGDLTFDPNDLIGKKLFVFVKPETTDGRTFNRIAEFQAMA